MKSLLVFWGLLCLTFSGVSQQKVLKVGDTIPDFKLWLIDGNRLTQKDIKDKVVVFKFWFTSCLPCVTDIPTLNELVLELKERDDILFVAPALDRKDAIDKFLYYKKFLFKIAYSSMDVSEVFNTKQTYPTYYVIDKKGKIAYIDSSTKQSEFYPFKKAIITALAED